MFLVITRSCKKVQKNPFFRAITRKRIGDAIRPHFPGFPCFPMESNKTDNPHRPFAKNLCVQLSFMVLTERIVSSSFPSSFLASESEGRVWKGKNLQNSHGFTDDDVRSLVKSAPIQLHLQKRLQEDPE